MHLQCRLFIVRSLTTKPRALAWHVLLWCCDTHPGHIYVVIEIVAWELSLQITRHLLSIERKL